jgi:hypothetical protein
MQLVLRGFKMSQKHKHPTSGPGGFKCPCCFPKPGSKHRHELFKKAAREDTEDALEEGLSDHQDQWDELE